MITTWVAILVVIVVGGLLLFWHFSGTQILSIDRRANEGFFDGVSGAGKPGADGDSSGDGGTAGGDGGAGGGD